MNDVPKTPSEQAEEDENREWDQIIHNACGMPIELCDYPNDQDQAPGPGTT